MKITIYEKKTEAIKRMRMLNLHENPIREFEQETIVNQSEHGGMLYWLDEKQQAFVKIFEAKHNVLVYHVIHDYTEFGELLSFLYISDEKCEWGYDCDDIRHGIALAYVKNLDDDYCSEFGSIGIKPQFGGIVRTA